MISRSKHEKMSINKEKIKYYYFSIPWRSSKIKCSSLGRSSRISTTLSVLFLIFNYCKSNFSIGQHKFHSLMPLKPGKGRNEVWTSDFAATMAQI